MCHPVFCASYNMPHCCEQPGCHACHALLRVASCCLSPPVAHHALLRNTRLQHPRQQEKLTELEDKIKDAETNLGEQEVRDALLAKAEYLTEIGDKDAALKAFDVAEEKTTGFGNKMDLVFSQVRCGGAKVAAGRIAEELGA